MPPMPSRNHLQLRQHGGIMIQPRVKVTVYVEFCHYRMYFTWGFFATHQKHARRQAGNGKLLKNVTNGVNVCARCPVMNRFFIQGVFMPHVPG